MKYFDSKVLSILNKSITISDILNLYYSFDYFKKLAINEVFKISNYDELITFSENFDLFAMNLNNVIMSGVLLFDKEDVSNVIVKKYRLSKINILDDDLHTDNIENVINKIRGLSEVPGGYFLLDDVVFKVFKAKKINDEIGNVGEIVSADKKGLILQLKDGQISLLEVQKQGKKKMDYKSFINGEKNLIGKILK